MGIYELIKVLVLGWLRLPISAAAFDEQTRFIGGFYHSGFGFLSVS